ncbi:MAG: ATP-binding protein [Elusimicrobiota bacterium]
MRRWKYAILSAGVVAGLAATAFTTREVSKREEERFQAVLAEQAHTRIVAIRAELDSIFQVADSIRSFFASSEAVTAAEFRRFTSGLLRSRRGIRALGWAPRRGREARIRYVEPLKGNQAALGYDLDSEPVRRAALRAALRGNKLAASGRIALVQETEGAAGMLVVGPVNDGFVFASLRLPDVVQAAFDRLPPRGLNFSVFDDSARRRSALLYRHRMGPEPDEPEAVAYSETFHVGGRDWRITCSPSLSFLVQRRTGYVFGVAAAGLCITGLLAGMLWTLVRRAEYAEALVALRTEELRASEERWKYSLEGSRDGVWDWDVAANKVFFSKRWKEMLGYRDDEISGGLKEWGSRVHPDDKAKVLADLNLHLEGKTPYYQNEHRVLCKGGSYKWVLDRGKVMARSPEGKPLRVVGTHTDISERRELEQQRDRLTQTLSHDLKNPLAAISAAMFLVGESIASTADAEVRKLLDIGLRNSKEMLDLINAVLDPSLFAASAKSGLLIRPLDAEARVRKAVESLEPSARRRDIRLVLDSGLKGARAAADERQLYRVVTNLLSNAIKFAPEKSEIRIGLSREDSMVRVAVTDRGRGIPADFRDKIFQPRSQARPEDKTEKGGAGLGLAGVKRMVEEMGGSIGYESEPDVRTTFFVKLPAA